MTAFEKLKINYRYLRTLLEKNGCKSGDVENIFQLLDCVQYDCPGLLIDYAISFDEYIADLDMAKLDRQKNTHEWECPECGNIYNTGTGVRFYTKDVSCWCLQMPEELVDIRIQNGLEKV